MTRRSRNLLAVALALLVVLPAAVPAQTTTGTVTGSVRDVQGGVIPGATVALISDTRGTKPVGAASNRQGEFVFANVPPGRYTIQVTMSGFKTFKRPDVVVSAGNRTSAGTLTLEVAGVELVPVKSLIPGR